MSPYPGQDACVRLVALAQAVGDVATQSGDRELVGFAERAVRDFLVHVAALPAWDLEVHRRHARGLLALTGSERVRDRVSADEYRRTDGLATGPIACSSRTSGS